MFVPCILYNLLFITTNTQFINNKVCIVKYAYIIRCIYFVFREFQITANKMQHFLIYLFLKTLYMFQAVPPPIIRRT